MAAMGTGIQRIFPDENAALAEEITASGGLVSQFPPDAPRTGTTFLLRNRVIAGLADASLVMVGRKRSGSRHELDQAMSYGRLALLWKPAMDGEQWANDLVASGKATFVSTAHEVVRLATGVT